MSPERTIVEQIENVENSVASALSYVWFMAWSLVVAVIYETSCDRVPEVRPVLILSTRESLVYAAAGRSKATLVADARE